MTRVYRIDYLDARLDFSPGATTSPSTSAATWTADGYLVVDAYIARDGLLEYSDGRKSWIEYRPRAELEKAAPTFAGVPVTHEHPKTMVKPDTSREVMRGFLTSPDPTVVEVDGVGYLQARVKVVDAELLQAIRDGLRELSIGFSSLVVPCPDGVAPDGTECDAIQTDLIGNHTAVVSRGRAGPAVRLLMDAAGRGTLAASNIPAGRTGLTQTDLMDDDKNKLDEAGAPMSQVKIVGPDGSEVMVPTWLAEMVKQAEAQKAQALAAEPAPPAPPSGPEADAVPPPMSPAREPDKDEMMGEEKIKDALREAREQARADARAEARLARKAARLGVPDEEIDRCDSYEELARVVLKTRHESLDTKDWSRERLDGALALIEAQPAKTQAASRSDSRPVWQSEPKPTVAAPRTKFDAADEIMMRKVAELRGEKVD